MDDEKRSWFLISSDSDASGKKIRTRWRTATMIHTEMTPDSTGRRTCLKFDSKEVIGQSRSV